MAGSLIGVDWRHDTPRYRHLEKELSEDADDKLHPVLHRQLMVQALNVRVNGVRRDAEFSGDGKVGAVVEDPTNDLKLPAGKTQASGDFLPRQVGDQGRPDGRSRRLAGRRISFGK